MIEPDSHNVFDIAITRPDRSGPGGDQVGDPVAVISGLKGYYESLTAETRSIDGSLVTITGILLLDAPIDSSCEYIAIHPGDFIEFTTHAGVQIKPREIRNVEPFYESGRIDHLEISF